MHLHSACQEIPKSSLVDLLDTVRTRVLNLALEIQGQVREDDPDLRDVEPATESLINQTVNQYIYGGQGLLSTGQSSMTVRQQNLTHNWENLEAALRASGVSEPELKELSSAVNRDGKTMGANVIGDGMKRARPRELSVIFTKNPEAHNPDRRDRRRVVSNHVFCRWQRLHRT
jgi:hypothetical protein